MIPLEPLTFAGLVLLGGIIAVDGTSFGQFMISRPFAAATLAGAVAGEPAAGAALGLVLEAFHLMVLPVGAARYPEGGPAAVCGAAVYASYDASPGALLIIVLLVLLLEWLGGETISVMRRGNVRLMHGRGRPPQTAQALERRHLTAMGIDFVRGMILVVSGILVLGALTRALTPYWTISDEVTRSVLTAVVAGLLAGAVRTVGWRPWFAAAGAIGGLALLLLV